MDPTAVRQSIQLSPELAVKVRNLAKSRRLSTSRLLAKLVESGVEVEARKERDFFDLAERFRAATDPDEVRRLGEELGRTMFV